MHVANVPVAAPGPSRRHSNVEPDSLEENANEAEPSATVPLGPALIEPAGGVVSTVSETADEMPDTLPAGSVAVAV